MITILGKRLILLIGATLMLPAISDGAHPTLGELVSARREKMKQVSSAVFRVTQHQTDKKGSMDRFVVDSKRPFPDTDVAYDNHQTYYVSGGDFRLDSNGQVWDMDKFALVDKGQSTDILRGTQLLRFTGDLVGDDGINGNIWTGSEIPHRQVVDSQPLMWLVAAPPYKSVFGFPNLHSVDSYPDQGQEENGRLVFVGESGSKCYLDPSVGYLPVKFEGYGYELDVSYEKDATWGPIPKR